MKERLRRPLGFLSGRWLMLPLRLALGGLFIASSLSKLQYPSQFTDSVLSYHMLPETLARFFATTLPFVELFIGCSLVLGIFVLFASALTIPLSLSLVIANIYALVRHVGGDTCSCLGSLLTMSHSAALAIDFAMLLSAALLTAGHREAGWLGLGRLLQGKRVGLDKVRENVLKSALILMCMVAAIGFLGVQKTPAAEAIDDALHEGSVVLVFRFGDDAVSLSPDLVVLSDLKSLFGETVQIVRCRTGQDPWADRKFPTGEQTSTLFIITGKNSSRFVVQQRFEGPLDAGTVEAAIRQILGNAGA